MLEITLFLRILVDIIGFIFAYRLFRQHRKAYKYQLASHVYGEDIYQDEIIILSYAPCTIDYLRFDFRFENSTSYYQPNLMGFYLHMQVTRGFGKIVFVLPFKLTLSIRDDNDDFYFEGKENKDFLILNEKNTNNKNLEILEIREFITALAYIHETPGRRIFTFPISHHYAVGTPFDKNRKCPHILSTKEEYITHPWYVPEVKLLDVRIWDSSKVFEPELERTYPPPDLFRMDKSKSTLQWLSGAECHRPYHSSIQIGFVNKELLEQGVEKSFISGVMVAIGLSLAVATGLDAIWQVIEIPWIEVFKIAKCIETKIMSLPFLPQPLFRH